ncbi:Fur family transcriptional regulator [Alkalibaculum sp. M08DMB]|uniref:Fur family transcriptional regulator n=1 Tax=Alkalibaculum sporogenes TaxID=2655001 RepID=A0A6A7KEA0_9FIRM|nr:iron dependent repressor, metal binding and dimerization domain protein [Alkalibaculum sporogenes]MPW27303.1 Fur family transcriptional regulator [Alkalibaculum sporogenes]
MSTDKYYTFNSYMNINGMSASEEDYLEMIYRMCVKNGGYTRVNDIACYLHVKPPSVTKMVKRLSESDIIDYKRYGLIKLTDKGIELGKFLVYRHNTVKEFLRLVNVEQNLHEETEKMEHTITESTLEGLKKITEFFKSNPEILKKFESTS